LQRSGYWHTQIQKLLIEQRDQVIFLPHDAVSDVVRVKFSCRRRPGRTLGGRDGCVGIFFTDRTNTPNNFWPRNGLNILLNALR
jgi:hypothetical protein